MTKQLALLFCLAMLPAPCPAAFNSAAFNSAAFNNLDAKTADDWKIAGDRIVTRFAKDVAPDNPLPEYPRPQMARKTWQNLNGLWEYAITARGARPESYDGKILVPYPIESALSGVAKSVGKDKELHYRRTFTVPRSADWRGKRVLLHFGAVDWDASVFLNGKEVGRHVGGYAPFSFDITDKLKPSGEQALEVRVWDPTNDGHQPIGKQHNSPRGIWYTPVTGIWQTVWMEPVAASSIETLKMKPDIMGGTLTLGAVVRGAKSGDQIRATVMASREEQVQGRTITVVAAETQAGPADAPLALRIQNPKLWEPDAPYLYGLRVELVRNNKALDAVDSYFGMREISLGKDAQGITRMMLNGKFVFQHGPPDQGWWPDGLYTAHTDEALAYDIKTTKQLGFNMLRKHVKVEPARFYHHCDKLGILVWQDMPSGDPQHYIGGSQPDAARSPEATANFEREWGEIIASLYNHPSIVVWVPFNEGWGQYDTCRILKWTKDLDPTRLVDGPSGWADRGCGDMIDMHAYRGPGMFPPEENRATVLGEYGGLGLPIEGHTWLKTDRNWGYGGNLRDAADLLETYMLLNTRLHPLIAKGLSAAVYTQTTDVEVEVNGLMTYDRIIKVDTDKFRASNEALKFEPPTYLMMAATAPDFATEWAYTTDAPADGWESANFDDSAWKKGAAGFGTAETPNATVRTVWDTSDIWLRRTFFLSAVEANDTSDIVLDVFHDEDCEVYINGAKVLETTGYTSHYAQYPIKRAAALREGANVIAVHCKQTRGGQYIDVGISSAIPPKGPARRVW
jgi:hypothetical protein